MKEFFSSGTEETLLRVVSAADVKKKVNILALQKLIP